MRLHALGPSKLDHSWLYEATVLQLDYEADRRGSDSLRFGPLPRAILSVRQPQAGDLSVCFRMIRSLLARLSSEKARFQPAEPRYPSPRPPIPVRVDVVSRCLGTLVVHQLSLGRWTWEDSPDSYGYRPALGP